MAVVMAAASIVAVARNSCDHHYGGHDHQREHDAGSHAAGFISIEALPLQDDHVAFDGMAPGFEYSWKLELVVVAGKLSDTKAGGWSTRMAASIASSRAALGWHTCLYQSVFNIILADHEAVILNGAMKKDKNMFWSSSEGRYPSMP